MSARNKKFSFVIFVVLILGAAVILTCSDKILNSQPGKSVEFQMSLKFSSEETQALAEIVTAYQVIIIADSDTITANLTYSNGSISGLVENVPAGPNRTVIVEGLAGDGTVIYRGSVVITVIAGATVDAEVTLLPVAKLLRVSPKFVDGSFGSGFVSNIRINNVKGLVAISLALDFNPAVVKLDSVKRGDNVPAGANFAYSDEDGLDVEISHSSTVVDTDGNGSLAKVFFSPVLSQNCLDSTLLDLGILSLTAPSISVGDVYVDDGKTLIKQSILSLSADTLYFGVGVEGLNLDFKKVDINDLCGNNVGFTISADEHWIDLNTALAGITPGSIFIDVNATGLSSGNYEGRVRVNSLKAVNSPYEIVVKLSIDKGVRTLNISPQLIVFSAQENGALPADRRIHVEELYQYSIAFNASEDAPWFSIDKTFGTTPDSIFVGITTTALAPGTYIDTVLITSGAASNSPIYVRIHYDVSAVPKNLEVVPDTFYFSAIEDGELPSSQNFRVVETAGYNIAFDVTENSSWLDLSGVSGITPDTISAHIISTELEAGIYYANITVSAAVAANSPQIVTVVYDVEKGPREIATDPNSLHFLIQQNGPLPESQEFRVFETAGHVINYSASEEASWYSVSGVSGTTPDTVTVSINSSELNPGMYLDSIQISSGEADNSPVWVQISLGVAVGPRTIEVEPDSVHLEYIQYSDAFPTAGFNVFETGGFEIPFSATENSDWFFLPNSGGNTPQEIDVYFDFAGTGLAPGIYRDSVTIISEAAVNSPVYVIVTLEIIYAPPPAFNLEPDTLYFMATENGELPDSNRFFVGSTHFPVPFIATESIPWLELSNDAGGTGSFVGVHITSTALEPAVYIDSIRVALSNEKEYDPVYEFVVYTVNPFIDSIPPSIVNDLKVDDYTTTSVYLTWTSSGDDSTEGTAAETDLRYATNLEILVGWESATQVVGEPPPQAAGSLENFEVIGLTPENTYYFALDMIDDAGNHSGLSNVDSVYLPPLPPEAPVLISPIDNSINISLNVEFQWHSSERADNYELQYDTDGNFGEPSSYSELTDTTQLVGPLNYETTYYWRLRASNFGGSSDWSEVRSFGTEQTPPTISGIVKDNEGSPLAGVLVLAYDSYPGGSVLDSTVSDAEGVFNFFDLIGLVELYVFKNGYYPLITAIEAPDTDMLIFLLPTPELAPSDQWVDLFCELSYSHGNPIQPNDVIEAYDPDGVLCGRFVVHTEGAYGYMQVYRDDETSVAIDEGCVTGDAITLKVNGEIANPDVNLIYPSAYQLIEACFDVTGEIPKWLVVSGPAGGETFYQDSSVSIVWTSTGVTGPVEIALVRSERELYVLDTTDNDGQENVPIPIGVTNGADWRFRVADLDESVGDLSEPFVISSVELELEPSGILLNGVLSDCIFDQKQFTISEKNGFAIPFEVTDTISWLSVSPVNGTTPAVITVTVLTNSLDIGEFESELLVSSISAINSPVLNSIGLQNKEYVCGDFDNDCRLRINDLSYLIEYLYRGGNEPVYPDALNVDLCDGVDIGDIDFLYNLVNGASVSPCSGAAVCTDDSIDLGLRDSLGFVIAQAPSLGQPEAKLKLDLYLFNDGNVIEGIASGFKWENPNMNLDSVRYAPYVKDSLSLKFAFEKDKVDTTNANDRFLLAANNTLFSGLPPSNSQQLLASYYFTLSSWTSADSIVVDTLTFNLGTTYKAVTSSGSYQPVWRGPIVIKEPGF